MALTSSADIAFALVVGAAALGLGATTRMRVIRVSMVVWLVSQGVYLPLQASVMSGTPPSAAWPVMPLVISQSHFGLMWVVGVAAGIVTMVMALTKTGGRTAWSTSTAMLAAALVVMAFAHAGITHAVDAGDLSVAMLVHTVHLLSTALWAGVAVVTACPLGGCSLRRRRARLSTALAYRGWLRWLSSSRSAPASPTPTGASVDLWLRRRQVCGDGYCV